MARNLGEFTRAQLTAQLAAAAYPIGTLAVVSDEGNFGLLVRTDGTNWVPVPQKLGTVAVAGLPAASVSYKGCTAIVTDSNAALTAGIGAIVAAGGANVVPVVCDGTNWRIG